MNDADSMLVRVRRPDGRETWLRVPEEQLQRLMDLAAGEFGDKSIIGGPEPEKGEMKRRWINLKVKQRVRGRLHRAAEAVRDMWGRLSNLRRPHHALGAWGVRRRGQPAAPM